MENNILDYEPKSNPEYKNNQLYSRVRFVVSAFLGVQILKRIYRELQLEVYQEVDVIDYGVVVLLPMLIYGYFIFYNIVQGRMELKEKDIAPVLGRLFQVLFIGASLWILNACYLSILEGRFNGFFIAICCLVILLREFKYFGHPSKLV